MSTDLGRQELYLTQAVHYLITEEGYQVIRVENQSDDIWLIHPSRHRYPVVCLAVKLQKNAMERLRWRKTHQLLLQQLRREAKLAVFSVSALQEYHSSEFELAEIGNRYVSNPKLKAHFEHLEDAIHDVAQPLEEIARLSVSLEETQMRRLKHLKRLLKWKRYPIATMILVCLCILIQAGVSALSNISQEQELWVLVTGGGYLPLITQAKEYWRVLSASLVQGNIWQMSGNVIILYVLGKRVETLYGSRRFAMILLLCLLGSGCVCALLSTQLLFYGLQYSLWALLGVYLANMLLKGMYVKKAVQKHMLRYILLCALTLLYPGCEWLICYMMLALGIIGAFAAQKSTRITAICAFALAAALMLHQSPQRVIQRDASLEQRLAELYQNGPLKDYGQYLQNSLQE